MSKRTWFATMGVICFLLGLIVGQQVSFVNAQGAKGKGRTWKYDFDMKARAGGTDDWDKARKFGVEIYLDENANNLVYITETGSIAVVPNK
jgi:hypothetical protein